MLLLLRFFCKNKNSLCIQDTNKATRISHDDSSCYFGPVTLWVGNLESPYDTTNGHLFAFRVCTPPWGWSIQTKKMTRNKMENKNRLAVISFYCCCVLVNMSMFSPHFVRLVFFVWMLLRMEEHPKRKDVPHYGVFRLPINTSGGSQPRTARVIVFYPIYGCMYAVLFYLGYSTEFCWFRKTTGETSQNLICRAVQRSVGTTLIINYYDTVQNCSCSA